MWEIKGKDSVTKATTKSLEYNGKWLGERYVSVTIESPVPVDFRIGDYLTYRDERFEINYDPSVIKSAPRKAKGDAFKYENIKFNSYADELTRCDFLDVVLNDNNIHHTKLPVFGFYAPTVKELADRIQANLDRLYPGLWTVEAHPEYAEKTEVPVQVSNIKVWGALQIAVNDFGAIFNIKGRHITIGLPGTPVGHVFRYGKGNGLYELEKSAETDQEIVTRLRAYGSTRNLPPRYYSNIGAKVALMVTSKQTWIAPGTSGEQLGTLHMTLSSHGKLKDRADVCLRINGKEYDTTFYTFLGEFSNIFMVKKIYEVDAKAIIPGQTIATLVSGASLEDFDPQYIDTSGVVLPNNLAVTNLMLPGFPTQSLREHETDVALKPLCSNDPQDPYVDSPNALEIGYREGSVYFDGSDGREEICPTLEGMTRELLIASGGHTDSVGNLDELFSADPVEDNGMSITEGDELKPQSEHFDIIIKDLGFNLWDYRTKDSPIVSFKSGKLGGRDFEIVSCVKGDVNYRVRCKRIYDESVQLWFPYSDYNAAAGDKIVLLSIGMPDAYVKVASQRLLQAAREYLSKHDYSRSVHSPKIDELMMARQHDIAMASDGKIASLHDTITEGMKMQFDDEDLGIDASIFIENLVIREGDGPIPKYEVTLKEEKTVGMIQKMQNQIDSILTGTIGKTSGGGGLGYTAQEIRQFIFAYGKERFLSKLEPDEAKALIKLLGGIEVGDFATGIKGARVTAVGDGEVESLKVRKGASVGTDLSVGRKVTVGNYVPGVSGGVFYVDENGEAHIETGQITVNGKLRVKEIEVQQHTWVGGAQILSPAGMVCEKVEPRVDGQGAVTGWKCLFRTQAPDGRKVWNQFRIGDLARCETFNLVDDDGYLTNRYYWRMVTEVGYETDAEGTQWGYILLSNVEGNYDPKSAGAGGVPLPGDSIVTMGVAGSLGDGNDDRRSLVILSSCGEGSPYIYQFKGINSFSLPASKLKTRISPGGNLFTGRFLVEAGGRDPEDITDIIDRQKPYSLRPSVRSVLVFHHEDADTGETFPSFSPAAFTCGLFKSSGTGEITKVGWGSLPPGMEVRATVRRHDAEAGASVDDPAYAYHGEVIYPEEDMRSVTFSLLIDGHTADEVAVSVQTDATALASEYRASLEVTEKAIEAQATKTNILEQQTASLRVTASNISSKVGRISANLIRTTPGMWDNPSQSFRVDDGEGGFSAQQAADLDSVWQTFRCPMDTSRFKPSTDYILSLDASFQTEDEESVVSQGKMAFRASVSDATQQVFLCPWAVPDVTTYTPGEETPLRFRLRTPAVLPPRKMFLQFIIRDWDDRTEPIGLSFLRIKLEEGTVATPWVPADKDLESIIDQQAGQIALSVKVDGEERAGMTLDQEEGITIQADKVRIKNGDLLAALFINGILNADLIEVSRFATKADGKTRVTIGEFNDAFIRFYHDDGVTLALKLGLDYVSLEEGATVTPSLPPSPDKAGAGDTARAAVQDATVIPIFRKGKPAVAQVFDEEGVLTWVLFLDGPVTPDTQPYSWRTYSLVRETTANQAAIRRRDTLKAEEYWQFKVRDGVSGDYTQYRNKLFTRKMSDTDFTAAAYYYAPDGRYFFPAPELRPATVTNPQEVWIRRYHDVKSGVLSSTGSITLEN